MLAASVQLDLSLGCWHLPSTVNSEIFASILFSRNFAHAKFRENKNPPNSAESLSFTADGKSCSSREF